ncbi:hypothetical protein LTR57_015360 [Friedmanniomyces endolithicus]|uniref:SH3 domain-containing protein n=1 Tax=Friedmanniomyces endolithicus TaxID=329885 RepID=A0AAN6FY38_9PEZI|nr:hypothetical protein LTR35_015744 [Friedmanniomyces endolithicus]KAK0293351.1 hypothetical protein LTS00_007597 [Friedmanniomyces endolithicus]KAK0325580.1 hypothetical protein LTR82_003115 [Friedmanniomyces endolithicus]KAK0911536.1 hypothetical protein LTR57_015360 [Friedmanniomyces endolithicus]KAK0971656.1 hypothetical protein LTS01_015286 [Friedmanniomyces endolithicus]
MAAPPFKVKAVYEYASEHDDDLKFPIGQVINVTELEGDDWYVGEYTDGNGAKQEGMFPSNFVEKYEPAVPTRPARAARPKSVVQPPAPPPQATAPEENERDEAREVEGPKPLPAATKPQLPPVEETAATRGEEAVRAPPFIQPSIARADLAPAAKPTPAEPAQEASTPAKGPPPIAPKSNAFKDRIAAFNRAEASPIAPTQPGVRGAAKNEYIKKPFVAPPPSRNAYIPPAQKVEPVHKPYIREEDPEIKRIQEDDHAAAEAAGLTGEPVAMAEGGEDEEDQPKPMSLKERMAMLQREQEAQRARHAEPMVQKKERKPPAKKTSESSERERGVHEGEDEKPEPEGVPIQRQSVDINRERPRVPSTQRRPAEPAMSQMPALPQHEILSGGEEADQSGAGEMTDDDAGTIGPADHDRDRNVHLPREPVASAREVDAGVGEDPSEEPEEEEMDEEEARKQRLRERMARLAGGQQGGGPFNPFGMPPAAAPARKRTKDKEVTEDDTVPLPQQQRMPGMIAIPGMGGAPLPPPRSHSPEPDTPTRRNEMTPVRSVEDEDDAPGIPSARRSTADERNAGAPPVPKDRPVPAPPSQDRAVPPPRRDTSRSVPRPPPTESRPVPPPPPPTAAPLSPGPGSESDDEMSTHAKHSSAEMSGFEQVLPARTGGAPPVPPARETPRSPFNDRRSSYFGNEPSSATSDKRASRVPPAIPGIPVNLPRPPPPPPPSAAPPGRQSTGLQPPLENTERGESDYEGDYDTDIASSAKRKDALKSHAREPSLDDSTTADEATPVDTPPAVPQHSAPRAVPPLPPQSQPRQSMDSPRAPPPVPPPTRSDMGADYDPYHYAEGSAQAPPPVPGAMAVFGPSVPPEDDQQMDAADDSSADDVPYAREAIPRKSMERAPPPFPQGERDRAPPLPSVPPPQQAPQSPQMLQQLSQAPLVGPLPPRSMPRQSLDVARAGSVKRSMDQPRPTSENTGQIAQPLDLAPHTQWWTSPQPLPPSLQPRNGIDILSESEESQQSKRGGRTTISKDIYILYMDYSQTVITAVYDSRDPSDVTLEQRHEAPPPKLRQDQLEAYWRRFGVHIAKEASAAAGGPGGSSGKGSGSSKDATALGDGFPASLPQALIRNLPDALLPVGSKAYGALVYANLANASTMQFDEIRAGDIVTLRNAKFEGHHGAIKSKYRIDYGGFHVGVVGEWDGTRRSVRYWEQGGREGGAAGGGKGGKGGGVKGDKLRLGDLRSGEVRVWRVVGRDWVGWSE